MNRAAEELLNQYCRYDFIKANQEGLFACVETLIRCFAEGGRLLICGNGGSCADADHVVGELVKSFRMSRPLSAEDRNSLLGAGERGRLLAEKLQAGLPAINLGAHNALMTALVNDVGGDYIFAQQVIAYGRPGDVLLGISTSGNSADVLCAGTAARAKGMRTIGLSGKDGGLMKREFELVLLAQTSSTEDIQDQHSTIYHAICAAVESEFWGN